MNIEATVFFVLWVLLSIIFLFFTRRLFRYLDRTSSRVLTIRYAHETFDVIRGVEIFYEEQRYRRYANGSWEISVQCLFVESTPFSPGELITRVIWEKVPEEEWSRLEQILKRSKNTPA